MSVSCLILTRDEASNLPGCLASLAWCDDIVVFDSGSTDATADIARQHGARVVTRAFDGFGPQREAARTQVDYRHGWVLAIDADERPDAQLVAELQSIADDSAAPHVAYRMRRKDHFLGRWIKHSSLYPSWFLRFYRPEAIRYPPRSVHEYPEVAGSVGALRGHLLHDSFGKGLEAWLVKHVAYARAEAAEMLRAQRGEAAERPRGDDPIARRRALKRLSYRLPFRPTLRFCYMYFVRLGLLDGRAGFHYCRLIADYQRWIDLFVRERRIQGDHLGQSAEG